MLQILGSGEYGEVWKGQWKIKTDKSVDVAVKSIKTSAKDPSSLDMQVAPPPRRPGISPYPRGMRFTELTGRFGVVLDTG